MKKTKEQVAVAMDIDELKPTIELNSKVYPKTKELKIDQELTLTVKVKIINVSRDRWGGNRLQAIAEIESIKDASN